MHQKPFFGRAQRGPAQCSPKHSSWIGERRAGGGKAKTGRKQRRGDILERRGGRKGMGGERRTHKGVKDVPAVYTPLVGYPVSACADVKT